MSIRLIRLLRVLFWRTIDVAHRTGLRRADPPRQGIQPARLLWQRPGLGRAHLHAARGLAPTAPSRWPCSPGSTHEMLTAPQIGELLAEVESAPLVSDAGVGAAVNVREIRRAYDRAVKLPQELVEELARDDDAGPAGLAGGPRGQRLRRLPALAGEDRRPQAPGGRGRRLQGDVPTTPCSTSTSRAPPPPRSRSVFADLRDGAGAAGRRPSPARARSRAHDILEREYPVERQQVFGAGGGGGDRLRLRRRPARRDDAPVLQRHRPRRLPHHHALQPAPLQRGVLRHPARGRPRHLRAGPGRRSTSARRWAAPARWAFTNRSRGCGRTRSAAAGRSGSTSSRGPGRRSRRPCATCRWTTGCSPSTTCGRRSSASRRTRRPTTCTSSCASSWSRR